MTENSAVPLVMQETRHESAGQFDGTCATGESHPIHYQTMKRYLNSTWSGR